MKMDPRLAAIIADKADAERRLRIAREHLLPLQLEEARCLGELRALDAIIAVAVDISMDASRPRRRKRQPVARQL
jgi:hypothetical protein